MMADTGSLTPIVRAAVDDAPRWTFAEGDDGIWIYIEPEGAELPERGWKLHVSAAAWTAHDVLARCLPVLLSEDAPFKVAASIPALMDINEGAGGIDQAGKFMTVYSRDGAQAVRLAAALDAATRGLRGPVVRTDRRVSNHHGLVHYRYGEFRPGAGDGDPPPDPFAAAGMVATGETDLVAGRFLITSTLHRSVRGAVHLAVDAVSPRSCILKHAYRDARLQPDGRDARDHLRHEAAVLEKLGEDRRFPAIYQTIEHDGDLFLAMEFIEGTPLSRYVETPKGPRALERARLVAWGSQVAEALGYIHEHGLVYRDLSPENVIVGSDGSIHLIDFELTAELGATNQFYSAGTAGFVSPQQAEGEPAAVADDIYGLGCLLTFAATGVDFSADEVIGSTAEIGSSAGPDIASVIASCLDPDPARRPSSAADIARSLREALSRYL
jgi:tRNA A-37 threonylcarbamoyl transferase component Bud32